MASAKQIAWRKKFAKLYGKKKKGGKSTKSKKSSIKKSTVVHDFIHNKPYGTGRSKKKTEEINRINEKIMEKLRKDGKW